MIAIALFGQALAAATEPATVSVVRAVPAEGDFPADIYLNGEILIDAFRFDFAAEPFRLASGVATLEVYPAGADPGSLEPVLVQQVNLEAGRNYSIVALVDAGKPVLSIYANDTGELDAGEGRLTIRQTSPAANLGFSLGDRIVASRMDSLAESTTTVRGGSYEAKLLGDAPGEVLASRRFSVEPGQLTIAYAVRSDADGSFEMLTQTVPVSQRAPKGVPTGTGGLKAVQARGPSFPVQSLDGAERSQPAPTPRFISLPTLGVGASIIPVGIDAQTREMQVPERADRVAWYRFGPTPGDAGSAVLAAHVDLWGEGKGVFYDLEHLVEDDRVQIQFSDGSSREFAVVGTRRVEKQALDLESLFAEAGEARVELVTCGGAFDPQTRRYAENRITTLVPVQAR